MRRRSDRTKMTADQDGVLPPVLFFQTGLNTDLYTLGPYRVLLPEEFSPSARTGVVIEAKRFPNGQYGARHVDGVNSRTIAFNGSRLMTTEMLGHVARRFGVTWIAPTVHASNEIDVAKVAAHADIDWPSVAAVSATTDKKQFSQLRAAAGLATPRSVSCVSHGDIAEAVQAFGGMCFLKPTEGYGSLAARMIDARNGLTWAVHHAIDQHLAERNGAGYTDTLAEEFIAGDEYGVTALVEDGQVIFLMTTRKEMTPDPFRKEVAHIVDTRDDNRRRVEPLIRADIEATVGALHRECRVDTRGGLQRAFVNADVIVTPDTVVHAIDFSLRMGGGGMARLGNAAVGRSCRSGAFETACVRWAAGHSFVLPSTGRHIAAIVRVAFPEGGFPLGEFDVRAQEGIVYVDDAGLRIGDVVVPPLQTLRSAAGHPILGVEAPDRETAERLWNAAMAGSGLRMLRPDGHLATYSPHGLCVTAPGSDPVALRALPSSPQSSSAQLSM